MPDVFFILFGIGVIIASVPIGVGVAIRLIVGAFRKPPLPQQFDERFKALQAEIEALRSTTTQHALSLQSRLETLDQQVRYLEIQLKQVETERLGQKGGL